MKYRGESDVLVLVEDIVHHIEWCILDDFFNYAPHRDDALITAESFKIWLFLTSKRLNFRKSHSNLVLIGSYREVHPSLDIVWSEQSELNLVTLYGPLTLFEWGAPKCPPPLSWLWYIRLKETEVGLDSIYYNHFQHCSASTLKTL